MATVRILISRAGNRCSYAVGQVVEVSDAEAKRLVKEGKAEPVSTGQVETAAVDATSRQRKSRNRAD